ncbi:MAG: acyl-CoA dehydrogenase C-terminal domain-containing protein [Pseudomonadota bacterium]
MPTYTAPTKDTAFILHDVLKVQDQQVPGYDELERDFTSAVLEEASKIATNVLQPLNKVGDEEGCRLENGVVRAPTGFEKAIETLREGGWTSFDLDPAYGGQGMPKVLAQAVGEYFSSANMALMMYPGLTHGAASAIHEHGSEEQKATYLPKMTTFEWGGTMNLTEPQCGTDLGLIRTKAVPNDDGSYAITGQKIWISAGEHDLADNIIHLVLAKLPDAPEGVKGISLFIVPKFLVNEDGSLGERNTLSCGGLESKMGIHGNATCVMNYDGAEGFLIGEPNKGLRAMFTMMNEARLGVGVQGLSQAAVAYENALAFAKDRVQGRAVTGTEAPSLPADPIIVHPDVRRMLMDQKAFVEGARAFALWIANLLDKELAGDHDAAGLVALMIPVLKAFLTDKGLESAISSQQVYGGSGYTTEWGAEQFVRDIRIALVYEGTNGIQALDLVGRKLAQDGGKHVMAFFEMVKSFLKEQADNEELADIMGPLKEASKDLQTAGMYFMQQGMKNPNNALAGSTDFLHLFGHVCLGFMWARMAVTSQEALKGTADDPAFYETKLHTARYYAKRMLPESKMRLARIETGADPVMGLSVEAF